MCVGIDCVSGESFGFDTIRLKENNLRIKFQDTSTTASFPGNDWQITANDSSSGGSNHFAIDDIDGGRSPFKIAAGARTNSLFVDGGGRIGFGTSTPVASLHSVTGNTPTLRLEQDGSSGFTPQTWDIAGNEANFFVRDATNGSTLPFRIEPGAPTSSLHIDSSGNIGLGTGSASEVLHLVDNNESPKIRLSGTFDWLLGYNHNNGDFYIRNGPSGPRPFKVSPGAPNNSLYVAADAKIGLGTKTPTESLHIVGASPKIRLEDTSGGASCSLTCSGIIQGSKSTPYGYPNGKADVNGATENKLSITFSEPLPDANYIVILTAVASTPGRSASVLVGSQSNTGFAILVDDGVEEVFWQTYKLTNQSK